jgi:CRP-like cAMP-binding protein
MLTPLPENRILAALPPEDYDRIMPRMDEVRLGQGDVIYRANGRLDYVYFPRSGILSAIVIMADGRTMEVGAMGREGMAGMVAVLGAERSPEEVVCQATSTCRRLPAAAFTAEVSRAGKLLALVHEYARSVLRFTAQSAACNGLHAVPQRCARWLLLMRDRAGSSEFELTQEYLATMLGVRRASVTGAAIDLQRSGIISYRRGRVTVLDPFRLEAAACECYGATRDGADRVPVSHVNRHGRHLMSPVPAGTPRILPFQTAHHAAD